MLYPFFSLKDFYLKNGLTNYMEMMMYDIKEHFQTNNDYFTFFINDGHKRKMFKSFLKIFKITLTSDLSVIPTIFTIVFIPLKIEISTVQNPISSKKLIFPPTIVGNV